MEQRQILTFLKTVPLLKDLASEHYHALARMLELQLVLPGGNLMREGQPGDAFFFILEGKVGVYKEVPGVGRELVAVLKPGDPAGHMCLIDGNQRSATCKAMTRTLVLKGSKRLFDRLFHQGDAFAFRFADAVAQDLCAKLRQANRDLAALYSRPEESIPRLKRASAVLKQRMSRMDGIRVVPQEHRPKGPGFNLGRC